MLRVVPIQRFRIAENGGGLLKGHAVLLEVAQSLSGIPREHISVYTLIRGVWEAILQADASELLTPRVADPRSAEPSWVAHPCGFALRKGGAVFREDGGARLRGGACLWRGLAGREGAP